MAYGARTMDKIIVHCRITCDSKLALEPGQFVFQHQQQFVALVLVVVAQMNEAVSQVADFLGRNVLAGRVAVQADFSGALERRADPAYPQFQVEASSV